MNALTYITRKCPRDCGYCAIKSSKGLGPELEPNQWKTAFSILKRMGIEFNLILGNETWLLKHNLPYILSGHKLPFALYTTCPRPLFPEHVDHFFSDLTFAPIIDNLSCGIDYPLDCFPPFTSYKYGTDSIKDKSWDGWVGLQFVRKHYPKVDCQGTITVHRKNIRLVEKIASQLTMLGVNVGINFIQWDRGGYDFFPKREEIEDFVFGMRNKSTVELVLEALYEGDYRIQNKEMLKENVDKLMYMLWHCGGDPYGGPTIDADGSLRCCGYRKGTRTPKFSIFDLLSLDKRNCWKEAVRLDALDCPGCAWSYPWMYNYWKKTDPEFGRKVFVNHAGRHIPEELWAKRNVE